MWSSSAPICPLASARVLSLSSTLRSRPSIVSSASPRSLSRAAALSSTVRSFLPASALPAVATIHHRGVSVRGVGTGREPELQANALQQPDELLALGGAEIGAQVVLEPGGELERALEQLPAGKRQVQLAGAPVEGVVPAF